MMFENVRVVLSLTLFQNTKVMDLWKLTEEVILKHNYIIVKQKIRLKKQDIPYSI